MKLLKNNLLYKKELEGQENKEFNKETQNFYILDY